MPVLIVSPNGTITERSTLAVAVQEHTTQPDPHVVNVLYKKMIVTTNMSQVPTTLIIPAEVELEFANHAVYTVNSGQTLDLSLCVFQKPHYDCFINNGGTIIMPEAGPGPTQDWSIKNLIAAGTAAIAGALNGLSAIFTGNVKAGSFTGPLTGNVTGNADTATTATNAINATGTGNAVRANITGAVITSGQGVSSGTINFGYTYNAAPNVVCTVINSNASDLHWVQITGVTQTGFTCSCRNTTGFTTEAVKWIAIGN